MSKGYLQGSKNSPTHLKITSTARVHDKSSMRDGELCCQPPQATCPPGQGSASTPTAHKGKEKELAMCISKFVARTDDTSRCSGLPERQEAMKAPLSGAWRPTRLHGVWAVPTLCVHRRPPRPVQTGGGRNETPSSTQLVALGRLLLFG